MNNDKEHLSKMLREEIGFIFDNDEAFMQEFASMEKYYIDLVEVSFTDASVKFVYIDEKGAHIADYTSLDNYYEWKDKNS